MNLTKYAYPNKAAIMSTLKSELIIPGMYMKVHDGSLKKVITSRKVKDLFLRKVNKSLTWLMNLTKPGKA